MAAFDVKPDPVAPGNYTGYSQGIRASSNTALGTLFEGLANTLDMAVKETDRQNMEAIEEDIFSAVDSVQDEFGVGSATDIQADAEETMLPAQLRRSKEHLDSLENAYQKGAVKESHYWARLNSMVRQLRAKYPGYRGEIDSMVSSVTGARPANALRNALFNEWQSEMVDAQNDPLFKLTDWASKNTGLPTDYYTRAERGEAYTYTELQAWVSERTAQEQEIIRRKSALELQSAQDAVDTSEVLETFRYEAGARVQTLIADATMPIGRNYAELSSALQKIRSDIAAGNPPDAAELQQYRAMVGQLITDVRLQLNATVEAPWSSENPSPLGSYRAQLSPDQIDQAIESALLPIKLIEQGFQADAPWSVMGSVTAYNEAQKTDTIRRITDENPVLERLGALQEILSPQGFDMLLSLDPAVQTSMSKVLLDLATTEVVMGDGDVTTAITRGAEAGAGREYYDALQTKWVNVAEQVTKGDLPIEQVQQHVQWMFGPDAGVVFANFTPASRFEYFKKIASPQVTKQMVKLRDMGDTDSWETYQTWVTSAFVNLFQTKVREMSQLNIAPALDVTWDSKNMRFSVNRVAPPLYLGGGANPFHLFHSGIDMIAGVPGSKSADNLNAAIQIIAPILRENDANVAEELYRLFETMGFDPNEQDMISSLMNSLSGFLDGDD